MGTRYAEIADLEALGMVSTALQGVSTADKNAALDSASDEVSGYLRAAGLRLPLTSWDKALTQWVVNVAAYRLLNRKGYNPNKGADEIIRLNYEDASRWMKDVATGRVIPDVVQSPPDPTDPTGGNGTGGLGLAGPVVLQARQGDEGVEFDTPQPRWLAR